MSLHEPHEGQTAVECCATSGRCYQCFRKLDACFCAVIPRIENRTDLLIVQHVRERFHPFNTARIVHKALARSSLLPMVAGSDERRLKALLQPGAALLYPGRDAAPLPTGGPFPKQLVVVDGTWHQAKTLVRDLPALARLPRYALTPTEPGRYRIRREPTATALSTVEAVIAALRTFEPQTPGFDQLLAAFDTMVDRQIAHPRLAKSPRRLRRRRSTSRNIPSALLGGLEDVVVCYGESPPKGASQRNAPLYWVAERLGSGERFARLIRPDFELDDALLGHLALDRRDFDSVAELAEACAAWEAFLRPDDVLAVYNAGVAKLLSQLSPGRDYLLLKSVELASEREATLDEQLRVRAITPAPAAFAGRAGQRLANLAAWVRYLGAEGRGAQCCSENGDAEATPTQR